MAARDKLMHFGACAAIAAATSATLRLQGAPRPAAATGGFAAAMAAGCAKEYGDRPSTGWDWLDIAADAFGAAAGCCTGFI